jgi:hypothetical protein
MIKKIIYIIHTMLTPNNSKYYRQKNFGLKYGGDVKPLQGTGYLCGTMCQVLAHEEHFFHGEPTCLFETLDTHGTIEWSSPCPLCWVMASGEPVKGSLLCGIPNILWAG